MNLFLVAGETSGDRLGADLIAALRAQVPGLAVSGVGGTAMEGQGLASLFPMTDLSVMGIGPVLQRLPLLLRHIRTTAEAIISARPDCVVLIDSPDFTQRVARRVRKAAPDIPIVIYVSPTVWAWRPGRAARMRPFTDLLLALLPFEPAVHARLGGPRAVYVGHPLMDHLGDLRPVGNWPRRLSGEQRRVVVLPGSRRSEIRRLLPLFGETLDLLKQRIGAFDLVLPAVGHLVAEITAGTVNWPIQPKIVTGMAAKNEAFRSADLALAASGTVTLELALAGLPHVISYRLDWIGRQLRRFVHVQPALEDIVPMLSAGLPNVLVAAIPGQNLIEDVRSKREMGQARELPVPEFVDEYADAAAMADALAALASDSPARRRQLAAFDAVAVSMALPSGVVSSETAASAILALLRRETKNADP